MATLLLYLQQEMKNKIFVALFICVLLIGVFLRFYKLGEIPNSLDWDEVSQGYNAYSILTTGRDEFGASYPATIRSFNDYKPPVYTYLTTLPVKIFGLSPFSVRFPAALFGSLSMLIVYGLVYELFKKEKYARKVALLSMFFFSISPMSIQFSRTGFDANVAAFFVMLGSWLFIRYLSKEKIWPIFIGVFFLGLSIYTAHSEKIFTPLLFVFLLFYARKFLLSKKIILISLIAFFAILNIFWFFDSETKVRSKGVLFTSSTQESFDRSVREMGFDEEQNDKFNAALHNRRLVYASKYIENYLSHFNLNYLFIHGDNARHHSPGVGVLYLVSLPLILFGAFFIIRRKIYSSFILFAWLFFAPLASSFAIDAPNYQRSLIFLPAFHVFEALGLFYFISIIKKIRLSYFFIGIFLILLTLNIFYFLHQHFFHTNSEYGKYWQYGYKEAIAFVNANVDAKKRVFFANDIEQGYMFYLFYNKYSPKKYLSENGSNRMNTPCYSIDNAYFGICKEMISKGDIYITSKGEESSDFKRIKKIDYLNKEIAVEIFERL